LRQNERYFAGAGVSKTTCTRREKQTKMPDIRFAHSGMTAFFMPVENNL